MVKKGICLIIIILLVSAVWVNVLTGHKYHVGSKTHIFGWGQVPVFSEKLAGRVAAEFKGDTYTTMTNGGYLLYKWYPDKKVFIDTFFSPHKEITFVYQKILQFHKNSNPDYLYQTYGVESAVVDFFNHNINKAFLKHPKWNVRYIDSGSYVFVRSEADADVLCTVDDIKQLPWLYKRLFANYLFLACSELGPGQLRRFIDANRGIMKEFAYLVEPVLLEKVIFMKVKNG